MRFRPVRHDLPRWAQFLRAPAGHAVQIYHDVDELAGSVADYLATGFEAGEPGVVIATSEHWSRFAGELAKRGCDAEALKEQGLLTPADAETTLAAFMDGDAPSAARFEEVVGGVLDRVAARHPGRGIRAFGEMVDILCTRGQAGAAHALEELWNDLAKRKSFSLLCGYRLDVFDRASQVTPLPGVCRTHSHVLPAGDSFRLQRAVDLALQEVLGPREAAEVHLSIARQIREGRVPAPQLALMWVSAHMPRLADRILASARAHYSPEPALSLSA